MSDVSDPNSSDMTTATETTAEAPAQVPLADQIGHEVCILFTVTAPDEPTTEAIAKTFAHFALHYPIPEWGGLISGLAFPMAPAHINKGETFRFNLNHVVAPEHPLEMFRTELVEV